MNKYNFKITSQSKKNRARTGELSLPHGKVQTPALCQTLPMLI